MVNTYGVMKKTWVTQCDLSNTILWIQIQLFKNISSKVSMNLLSELCNPYYTFGLC